MKLLAEINRIQKEHKLVLFLILDKQVYWIKDHWKFLHPIGEADTVRLGTTTEVDPGQYYVTEELKSIQHLKQFRHGKTT